MELTIFIKDLVGGFVLCAPFGPIGLMCVTRMLSDGKLAGIASVLGASVMDAFYCAIAGLGISFLSRFLNNEPQVLPLAGGFFLVAMGFKICRTLASEHPMPSRGRGLFGAFGSSFFLMLTNPLSMLIFTALFSALGIRGWKDAAIPRGCWSPAFFWVPHSGLLSLF